MEWKDWQEKARLLKRDTFAVYLVCRDERVSWTVKAVAGCVVAYAFSPVDLIPDFIPVLGYLDDIILVPLGIALVLKMIPPLIMAECRIRADETLRNGSKKPKNWTAAGIVICLWILAAMSLIRWICYRFVLK